MNKLKILIILALFLGVNSMNAQAPSLRAYQKAAKKAVAEKDFYSAWKFYSIALEIDSTKIENIYNLAESARKFKSYNVARDAYLEVLGSDNKADYPLAEYWLANVYQSQAASDNMQSISDYKSTYDRAILHYQNFANNQVTPKGPSESSSKDYTLLARKAAQNCKWAQEKLENPKTGYKIKPFENGVNTPGTEFAPIEFNDNVYYSALGYDKENFCPNPDKEITRLSTSTQINEGQLGPINWKENEKGKFIAHTTFNNDGTRIYFTVCTRLNASEFDCEIYYRQKDSNGMWGENAARLPDNINLAGTTSTQPNIGFDNEKGKELLLFVSNRADVVGGQNDDLNIYCSYIEADGQVGSPEKLNINTEKDDITPFFNQKTNKLYFSSNGYQGFGGFDIYESEKMGLTFGTPEAMSYPLNTSYDDIYFSTDKNFSSAYFSSNRLGVKYESEGMETCCNDIYKLEIIQVELLATTFNGLAKTGLDSCNVLLYDIATDELIEKKLNPEGNDYFFPLELDKEYMIISNRDGRWTMDTSYVSTKGLVETTKLERELFLIPNVDLIANTFDNATDDPLFGCTFEFYDEETGELILKTKRIDDNRFYNTLEFGKKYKVVASKNCYSSDEVSFTTKDLTTSKTFKFPLNLEPEPDIALSVILYFDNDEPDKRTRAISTSKTYKETYNEYIKTERLDQFLSENGKGLSGEDRLIAQDRIKKFFDTDVKTGMIKLDLFAQFLERYLPQGHMYEIEIEGFASPRAPSDYNKSLTSRRVSSVENYLRKYNRGVLAPYIGDTKNLRIKLVPKGEDPSSGMNIPSASSDPKSIYSVEASKQRKVELIKIIRLDKGACNNSYGAVNNEIESPSYGNNNGSSNSDNVLTSKGSALSLDLIANTYDKSSRSALSGCTFTFMDETTGATLFESQQLDDNRFSSYIELNKRYRIVASKSGYSSDEVSFNTKGLSSSRTFTFPLYLEPSISGTDLPVILYFDNDEPDKRTRATTTSKTYEQSYQSYIGESRVEKFVYENSKNITGELKINSQDETRIFFDRRVREGMNRLELLAQFLERTLPQGNKYKMELEGFASPRAPSDYNKSLTSRRVSSVENYLRQYNGGVLSQYIGANKGLNITLVPRGEQSSEGLGIPSDYSDPKSIYSIEASEQRKVTIVRVISVN